MVGVGRICRPSFRCGHRPSPSTLSLPSAAVANSPLSPLLPPCLLLPHNRDGTMDARSDVVASSTERACGGGSSPCRSWINVRWQGEAAKGDLAALQLPPVANPNKMSSQVNPRWSADELDEWFRTVWRRQRLWRFLSCLNDEGSPHRAIRQVLQLHHTLLR
ncbi:hypothetical protein BDA96_09G106500 [Sorghum bicolor]|uniref:Uncharacterized protein n=2 Tax=Sorghum bicolor TaxID=4558 RepID=A0A1B6P802_SORBI|nr:hypothetical protein BDA96_09G106500 [Sorghum bicolor]KXG21746.1 hypothetical protein SORBI_3009G102500 [Sorghum bicolor]KXG21747.1 hypothetical protein SORBI_3009G102500 [Sorghum bicolor]